ncbi:MAG: serine hydrolase [Pseudomonadales bacterium]|jgi:CubicO group peptidase (beta-lactamase class C family)|nr:serine hydrolase [Pseudomonadales bacterium]
MSTDIGGVEVNGHFDEHFAGTVEQFARNFRNGADIGASFALSKDGEFLVDIWAGHLDGDKQQPWKEDTIVNVYSSTKTVSFLCALVLADRGLLDFDEPVATYWPEFAQSGKDKVLVWHLMNHASGLSGMDVPVTSEDMYDLEKMTSLLAAQKPWWKPGSATGYHALTQGYLIGEVVRRVTGKTLGKFMREDLAEPLGADFFIGVPESEFDRIGHLFVPPGTNENSLEVNSDPNSIAYRTFSNPAPVAEDSWTSGWKKAEIPAANGHGNARSLVRLQTPLACGGSAFGVDLISEKTARSVMLPRIDGHDLCLNVPLTFGLGFGLNRGPIPISPNENACYWGGWGGSSVLVDQDARVAMSFVMNNMFSGLLGDTRSFLIRQKAYEDLGR